MIPKRARFIDYWAGNAICLIVSFIYNLTRILPRKIKSSTPNKILFLELSEMGSAILSYPAMNMVKERYPDAEIYFWIFDENADGVRVLDIIPEDRIITTRCDNPYALIWDTLKNIVKIRKIRIDTIIDMELFSRFSSILVSASGALRKAGFYRFSFEGLYRASVYTHKVMYNPYIHISRNFINLASAISEESRPWAIPKRPLDEKPLCLPVIKPDLGAQKRLHDKLAADKKDSIKNKTIVVMNPGLGDPISIRKWPIENYGKLAKKFCVDKDMFVVLIGKNAPTSRESRIITDVLGSEGVINLIGKTDAKELLELFRIASLFISHDSGAVNFASLTDIGIIVLFGPETPTIYAPLAINKTVIYKKFTCSPCLSAYNHRASSCRDNRCIKQISAEEVYEKAIRHLDKKWKDDVNIMSGNTVFNIT